MKDTITSPRPAPQRVGPPPQEAGQSREAQRILAGRTAWLRGQVTKLHFKGFVVLWGGGLTVTLIAVCILLVWLLPRLIYLGEAMGSYQPGIYSMQGQFAWPGEDSAHQSTVILTYTDRLTIVTIPAGDPARTASTQSDTQRGQAPRIESVTTIEVAGKPALKVTVTLNYLSLFGDHVTFTLVNNSAKMSADPKNPNYRAPGFLLQSGGLS